MLLKDYYKTLEISPTASEQEVKRSFRRLVLRYHPDKNNGDALAEARFREIREAYETLSDPRLREEYNYKRWYHRSLGKLFRETPLSPAGIVKECERLYQYVQALSSSRVDADALSYHIRTQLLNGEHIRLLRQFNDAGANRQIIRLLIAVCRSLPWRYIEPVAALLQEVAGTDTALTGEVAAFTKMHRAGRQWDRWRVAIVLIVTAILCWLIYSMAVRQS